MLDRLPDIADSLDPDVSIYWGVIVGAKPNANMPIGLRAGVAELGCVIVETLASHSNREKWMGRGIASAPNIIPSTAVFFADRWRADDQRIVRLCGGALLVLPGVPGRRAGCREVGLIASGVQVGIGIGGWLGSR